jgi:hypothetical protein
MLCETNPKTIFKIWSYLYNNTIYIQLIKPLILRRTEMSKYTERLLRDKSAGTITKPLHKELTLQETFGAQHVIHVLKHRITIHCWGRAAVL